MSDSHSFCSYLSLSCAAQKKCQGEPPKHSRTPHFDLIFRVSECDTQASVDNTNLRSTGAMQRTSNGNS